MKIVSILFSLLFSLSLWANEDKGIKDALLKYNYGIIKMAKTGETQFFKSFTTKEVAEKLMVWFESWKFSNLTFIANINDLRFSPIAYNEHNATIRTMENWTFKYYNLATKKLALEPTNIFYKMHYTLEKRNGIWTIVAVTNLEEKVFAKPNTHKPSVEPKKEIPKEKIETH